MPQPPTGCGDIVRRRCFRTVGVSLLTPAREPSLVPGEKWPCADAVQQDAGRNDGDRHPRQFCRGQTRDAVAQGIAQVVEAPDSANSELPHEPALRVRGRRAHEQQPGRDRTYHQDEQKREGNGPQVQWVARHTPTSTISSS